MGGSPGRAGQSRLSGSNFDLGVLVFDPGFQKVTRLAIQLSAKGFQGGKPNGSGLVRLQDGEVRPAPGSRGSGVSDGPHQGGDLFCS